VVEVIGVRLRAISTQVEMALNALKCLSAVVEITKSVGFGWRFLL
jgi:hypothetical protein